MENNPSVSYAAQVYAEARVEYASQWLLFRQTYQSKSDEWAKQSAIIATHDAITLAKAALDRALALEKGVCCCEEPLAETDNSGTD